MKTISNFLFLLVFIVSCKKADQPATTVIPVTPGASIIATLSTEAITSLAINTAISGGNINSDGGSPIIGRGICFSQMPNPTIANTNISSGTGTGSFLATITNLKANTTYYVRAYATNRIGTAYGNQQKFTTLYPTKVTDADGNVYRTVKIGDQVWMAENLNTTKYRDGSPIRLIEDDMAWRQNSSGAFCNYLDKSSNAKDYGRLYNWSATQNNHELAPKGWHIPSEKEWKTLVKQLGGAPVAGGSMKEANFNHWLLPNTGADNNSKFTALPGGYRNNSVGFAAVNFNAMKTTGEWWSSTDKGLGTAASIRVRYNNAVAEDDTRDKGFGLSVRCIMD